MKIFCTEGQVLLKTELPALGEKKNIYIHRHIYIHTFNYTGLLNVLPSATQEVCELQNKARKCDSNRSLQVTQLCFPAAGNMTVTLFCAQIDQKLVRAPKFSHS